jgi:hypothetical protein
VKVGPERYSKRLWGHGRLRQLLCQLICRVLGHRYTSWNFDWPYDVPEYWEEIGESVRDPKPHETLMWGRGCSRRIGSGKLGRGRCGLVQGAEATLLERAGLPGDVTRDVVHNPIRYTSGFTGE